MKPSFLIFGGTIEGRLLTETLSNYEVSLTVCVATEYGESLLPHTNNVRILAKRQEEEEMLALLKDNSYTLVIDATHPYATLVSANIKSACDKNNTPYLRVLRDNGSNEKDCVYIPSIKETIEYLNKTTGNIFVTTGSKELHKFTSIHKYQDRIYCRVLPSMSVLEECINLGFTGKHLMCMQGPFSEEVNYALIKQYNIKYLVTKQTGKSGGYEEKINAAKRAGVTPIVIGLPEQGGGLSFCETLSYLLKEYGLSLSQEATPKDCKITATELPDVNKDFVKITSKRKVTLLSVGPGKKDYLTKKALDALEHCDLIIGATRVVDSLSFCNKPFFTAYKPQEIVSYLEVHTEYRNVILCYSGDIGFYSGAKGIYPMLSDYEIETIPGVSSLVYFCSKLQIPWEDVVPISLHGKNDNLIDAVTSHSKVFALLDSTNTVSAICSLLCDYGLSESIVHIGESLSYDNEQIQTGMAKYFVGKSFQSLSVILIENNNSEKRIVTHGLEDSEFIRGDVPMTKSEIRSISISKLGLCNDSIVYDIGAGTGSVAIEMSRQCTKGHVYAIEKKKEAIFLIEENKRKLQVSNLTIIEGIAPSALSDLPVPTHAFIGGSSGNMNDILTVLIKKNPSIRIVINCIAIETLSETINSLKELSITDFTVINATIGKSKSLGNYHMMMGQNPVTIITCNCGNE